MRSAVRVYGEALTGTASEAAFELGGVGHSGELAEGNGVSDLDRHVGWWCWFGGGGVDEWTGSRELGMVRRTSGTTAGLYIDIARGPGVTCRARG